MKLDTLHFTSFQLTNFSDEVDALEEMVGDRETADVLEDHRVGVHQVLNIGTGRSPRNG